MKRITGAILILGILAALGLAQEPSSSSDQGKAAVGQTHKGAPNAEEHLRLLTEKLNLTSDQQVKVRPILQEWSDSSAKVKQDQKLTEQERTARLHSEMMKADKRVREVLTDEQKKTLDELEQQHFGPHHNPTGSTPSH